MSYIIAILVLWTVALINKVRLNNALKKTKEQYEQEFLNDLVEVWNAPTGRDGKIAAFKKFVAERSNGRYQ